MTLGDRQRSPAFGWVKIARLNKRPLDLVACPSDLPPPAVAAARRRRLQGALGAQAQN
jgi:hypothetical protein